MKPVIYLLTALVPLFISLSTYKAMAQFTVGPVASALGGAGRSGIDAQEAGFLNPASLAHLRGVFFSGVYGVGSAKENGDWSRYGFLITDASPQILLPGSVSFLRGETQLSDGQRVGQQDIQVSFGQFVTKGLSLGAAFHRQTDDAPGESYAQLNGHLGFLYTPFEWLGFGITAHDLAQSSERVPEEIRLRTKYGLGLLVIPHRIIRVRLDFQKDSSPGLNDRIDVMTGLESWVTDTFAVRAGGKWQETRDQMYLTGGVGYMGPKLRFDYSLQKEQRGSGAVRHMIDLWLPF